MTKKVFTPCSLNRLLYLCFLGLCVFAFLGITASVADDNQTGFTPDVVGMTVGDAVGAFKDAGFTNSPNIVTDALVTGQNPPAGTEVSIQEICTITTDSDTVSGKSPVQNPYLASSLYAITHFDSSQSDSTPYGPPNGVFTIDPTSKPIVNAGPINIITLASTQKDYMWGVGSDRVSYVYVGDGGLTEVAGFEALEDATGGLIKAIPKENFQTFAKDTAVGMNTTTMDDSLMELFGKKYSLRFGNGIYSVVDSENVLYTNYGSNLYAFALTDPENPAAGITPRYVIKDIVTTIQGADHSANARLFGLSMTYDGYLIVTFSNGVAVINRDLDIATASFYQFGDDEYVSNSLAVDENNGIYIASDKIMRKLVWNGTTISDVESDGAWSSIYTHSTQPPIIKVGIGTGSTPTLMGFGDDDRLVLITDGAQQMNLVAFWRDEIPEGSERIAGQIPVTCGFTTLPDWIQSEQSVVVSGYGAFVVNNMPNSVSDDLIGQNKILQVSLMGPAYETSYGAERFEWNPEMNEWSSVWSRPDVSSTSMVPIHSDSGNMALINGYRSPGGWEILGLDWDTGETVHQTIFGDLNGGNGAYAILQYLEDSDALFNSFSGPIRIDYNTQ
ncbi:PASTA domain-containing protein [Methanospirillum sp. J.3.6.1-F.2.7.3]|uniref:PASTA domain-containing protein n=1 Tax=Methanospirillum purgamenti TaxID=2834276 RepID=A0A8E7AV76_9EURY|nr:MULTISPECIES: PASTA domain-containing protein [Methanospirillum]MDX8551344.1 PASTA domain-containing protein [Methanospirillum hungatei]QVV87890.1 PASTA domain-containing protein [Methanospirillum sp. J.3.6.1-F.2.7.3]